MVRGDQSKPGSPRLHYSLLGTNNIPLEDELRDALLLYSGIAEYLLHPLSQHLLHYVVFLNEENFEIVHGPRLTVGRFQRDADTNEL
jgi:hypothetical protein